MWHGEHLVNEVRYTVLLVVKDREIQVAFGKVTRIFDASFGGIGFCYQMRL
jgi:hypothetical protein